MAAGLKLPTKAPASSAQWGRFGRGAPVCPNGCSLRSDIPPERHFLRQYRRRQNFPIFFKHGYITPDRKWDFRALRARLAHHRPPLGFENRKRRRGSLFLEQTNQRQIKAETRQKQLYASRLQSKNSNWSGLAGDIPPLGPLKATPAHKPGFPGPKTLRYAPARPSVEFDGMACIAWGQ